MKTNLLIAVLLLGLVPFHLFSQDTYTLVEEGQDAPGFQIKMEDGTPKSLSDLKGKVVWINFFATWCPPCRKELPHLEKDVVQKFQNHHNFELLVIGREHNWEEINQFKAENSYQFPFYPDTERAIFSKYARQNIPRNFIIGKDGKIIVSSTGFTEDEFQKLVEKTEELLSNP